MAIVLRLIAFLPGMLGWDSSHLYSSGTLPAIPESAYIDILILN